MHSSSQCEDLPCRRIRVLVADEHAAVRQAMATFLFASDEMELAGQAASGREALALCASTRPDVVLLDVTLPDMSGAAATRVIRKQWPHLQVIAMSSFQDEGRVHEVLEAGAAGCLLKNVTAAELASTIRRAHAA